MRMHESWSRLYGRPIDLVWESMRPPCFNVITTTPPSRASVLHWAEFVALTFLMSAFGTVYRQVHYHSIIFEKEKELNFLKHVISDKTRASVASVVALRPTLGGNAGRGRMHIVGSLRHLYSPRLNFEVSTSFS
jgi:hypothetical protein